MSRPVRRRSSRIGAAVVVLGALIIAACGGQGDSSRSAAPHAGPQHMSDAPHMGQRDETDPPGEVDDSDAPAAEDDRADAVPETAPPAPPTGVVHQVFALDNSFRPEALEIAPGDEVLWINRGRNDHDVTPADGGGWGIAIEEFGPGDEHRHVFTEVGEFDYYCSPHGTPTAGMIGTIIVREG